MQKPAELAEKFFGVPYEALDERAKKLRGWSRSADT